MNRKGMGWVFVKTPVKLNQSDKIFLLKKIEAEIEKTSKLRKSVSRIEIRAGRVYLYSLYEQFRMEGVTYSVPLIDGKYLEFISARITLYDKAYRDCSLDWQRHNNQWMTLETGSLEECIQEAEINDWIE